MATTETHSAWPSSPERRTLVSWVAAVCVGALVVVAAGTFLVWSNADARGNERERADAETDTAREDVDRAASETSSAEEEVVSDEASLNLAAGSSFADAQQIEAAQQALARSTDELSRRRDTEVAARERYAQALGQLRDAESSRRSAALARTAWLAVGIPVVLAVSATVLATTRQRSRIDFENRQALDSIKQRAAEWEGKAERLSLPALWTLNREQISSYHTLVLNYSRSSRALTARSLAIGYVFILVTGLMTLFADSTPAAIAGGATAAAVAALTGFVTNAIIRNSESSAGEVRAFFNHPIEVDRMLAAERIATGLQQPQRDEVLAAIAKAAVNSTNAVPPG